MQEHLEPYLKAFDQIHSAHRFLLKGKAAFSHIFDKEVRVHSGSYSYYLVYCHEEAGH